MYKIEILQKNKSFLKDLSVFLIEKSLFLKRDLHINNILTESSSLNQNIEYMKSLKKIPIENVYGSTYQSQIRSNDNIYAISHYINFIIFEEEKVFALIDPAPYGEPIDFDKGVLVPVYWRPLKEISLKIATFDISFDIINSTS